MKLHKLASLVVALTAAVSFAAPALQANAQSGNVKSFEVDCNQTGFTTTSVFTCKGSEIGNATLVESNFNVVSFSESCPAPNTDCFLDAETLTLTTPDGSTLTFDTSGTQFNETNVNFKRNNTYFITGGTGRFAKVTAGAGNYVLSGNLVPGSNFFPSTIHLDGNILGTQDDK